ncbi:hypothetical protein ABVK25_009783 [Lepraria finkii]|uniref:Uncharacterized protein n=1 Tax=Lepraria finkii TaxID=1340010 RepID=A0ABR4AWD7_9LECA
MRLNTLSSFLTALALRILPSHGFPIAFSEHKLEEINALRAEGISEAAIAARFPRALIIPAVTPLETPQLYPVVHSAEVLDAAMVDIPAQFRYAHGRKRRLTQSVGKRGQEMRPRF